MPGRPDLSRISGLPSKTLTRSVFRVVVARRRNTLLSTEGNRYYPGRYHLAGQTGVLCTSLEADLAIRELGRHAHRRHLDAGLAVGCIRIRLTRILDLTDERNLRRLGLTDEDLIDPQHYSITQAIGLEARRAGFQGLLVP